MNSMSNIFDVIITVVEKIISRLQYICEPRCGALGLHRLQHDVDRSAAPSDARHQQPQRAACAEAAPRQREGQVYSGMCSLVATCFTSISLDYGNSALYATYI